MALVNKNTLLSLLEKTDYSEELEKLLKHDKKINDLIRLENWLENNKKGSLFEKGCDLKRNIEQYKKEIEEYGLEADIDLSLIDEIIDIFGHTIQLDELNENTFEFTVWMMERGYNSRNKISLPRYLLEYMDEMELDSIVVDMII